MYRDRIAQNYTKMEQMQETLQDFDRVKRYIGEDKAQLIINRAKYDEKIEAEQNRQRQVRQKGMSR
jgi:dTDP-4-dehydrorhamnose reductase